MSIASDYVEQINSVSTATNYSNISKIINYNKKDAEQVQVDYLHGNRWSQIVQYIYRCIDDSYFTVTLEEPATEDQEGQDITFETVAELVEPREVITIKYLPIK